MSLILDGTNGLSDVDGTAGTPAIRGSDANTGVFFGTDIVGVSTGGSERMRVDASGNVGIGTSSPVGKLNVIGGLGLGAALTGDQAVTPPSGSLVLSGSNQSSEQTYTSPGGATTLGQVYNYASSGNSFFRYLDIVAYGSTTGAGSNIRFITGNGTTNTERARIDSSGNLLVGTTSSQALTTIYRTTSGDVCTVENTNNGSHANFVSRRAGTSGQAVYFGCAGNQAGTITHPTTTSTNYGSGSDYRLKDNIQPLDNALSVVVQLKPSKWNWKTDGSEDTGFIAHELQEFFPSAVTGEKDAVDENGKPVYQCIDTSFLVATLTAAIQELKAINDAQAQTIESLTARVVALEGAQIV
jgi:hypothetical protein